MSFVISLMLQELSDCQEDVRIAIKRFHAAMIMRLFWTAMFIYVGPRVAVNKTEEKVLYGTGDSNLGSILEDANIVLFR